MKSKRQKAILDLIRLKPVSTQEELLAELKNEGYDVTQATISRDMRELGLVKVPGAKGTYKYSAGQSAPDENANESFVALFKNSVISIDYSLNIVVVKCRTGMANAVCVMLDHLSDPDIVGTLSGDDTFFVVTHGEDESRKLSAEFRNFLTK